ncbi:MAG: monofunctional biosynthetic peptidoglycan transglycosylase [Gammaproteobacteria bacterium]
MSPRRTRRSGRDGPARRIRKGLAWLVLGWLGLSLVLVLPLRWLNPATSAFMLQARQDGFEVRWEWADWDAIAPAMAIAAVAAEDQRFPSHHGFDLHAIRSVLQAEGGPGRGASTISQQVAKNLWLWPGRSWLRKGLEAWLTVCVEALWPKRRILEIYLNAAEFGAGLFGVEAAARHYFGKSAATLSPEEAARLAAVLPAPRRMNPAEPGPYVRERSRWIMEQVRGLGGPAYLRELR